jgi:hypothetical protein
MLIFRRSDSLRQIWSIENMCLSNKLVIKIQQRNKVSKVTIHRHICWTRHLRSRTLCFIISARNSLLVFSGRLVLKSVGDRSVVLGDFRTKFGSECAVTLHRALQYTTHRSVPPLKALLRRLVSIQSLSDTRSVNTFPCFIELCCPPRSYDYLHEIFSSY